MGSIGATAVELGHRIRSWHGVLLRGYIDGAIAPVRDPGDSRVVDPTFWEHVD
jgi:hypothetical protein